MKSELKHNDRQRMAKWDGYSRFIDEWLLWYDGPCDGAPGLTRESIVKEAFERFRVREEYEKRV